MSLALGPCVLWEEKGGAPHTSSVPGDEQLKGEERLTDKTDEGRGDVFPRKAFFVALQ